MIRFEYDKSKYYWKPDPKGVLVTDRVIFPLLEVLYENLKHHVKTNNMKQDKYALIFNDMKTKLEKGTLQNNILSYISKKFYFDNPTKHLKN